MEIYNSSSYANPSFAAYQGAFGGTYSYGLDPMGRISYLVINNSGVAIEFKIAPTDKSYISRKYDFAGSITGMIITPPAFDSYTYNMRTAMQSKLSQIELDEMTQIKNSDIDFWAAFGADKKKDLYTKLMYMPRYAVEDMVWSMIRPNFAGINGGNNLVYTKPANELRKNYRLIDAALVDAPSASMIANVMTLFTEANFEAMKQTGLVDPYDWEEKKSRAFQQGLADADLSKRVFDLLSPQNTLTYQDSLTLIKSFEARIKALPKLADTAIQLQRDMALAGFLAQGEYEQLNVLLTYYEKLPQGVKDAMGTV